MVRTSLSALNCSLAQALDIVGDGWTMLVLRDLFLGAARFEQLRQSLGVARNILTVRLKTLVAARLVARTGAPRRPLYALTAKGFDIIPALIALTQWGDRWYAPNGSPMLLFDDSGRPLPPMTLRDADGALIAPRRIEVVPGPGAEPRTAMYIEALAPARRGRQTRR